MRHPCYALLMCRDLGGEAGRERCNFQDLSRFSAFFECFAARRLFIFRHLARHLHASRMQPRGFFKPRSLQTINAATKPGVENSISGMLAPESPKKRVSKLFFQRFSSTECDGFCLPCKWVLPFNMTLNLHWLLYQFIIQLQSN